MQVERKSGTDERIILTAMIVDDSVLAHVNENWTKDGLFASRFSNLIGEWCCGYFTKYGRAPRESIEGLFSAWAEDNNDKDTTELVERFLEKLSGNYEDKAKESNTDYIVDVAQRHFNRVRVSKLTDSLGADVMAGDVDKALERVDKFSRIEVGTASGIDVLLDTVAIRQAFKRKADPLIVYPGALGNFFKSALERDALIAFQGPEKRGKTFWLIDMAWRAMLQGRRVAFFEVGDMSEGQIMLRFMTRASKRPLGVTEPGKPIRFPTEMDHSPDVPRATVEHKLFEYDEPLTWREAQRNCERIVAKCGDGTLLKLSCHPNSTIGVQGIYSLLHRWERHGWGTPDVIVIDYADVLMPPTGHRETRDQINATWKELRALSQQFHALVVTATQSDAESYTVETMTMGNFSEDKRKNAHVTGIVGINQTASEKRIGVQRLNWLALRESEFTSDDECHVAGCFGIANPAILSTF